jgi:hypothetical protein
LSWYRWHTEIKAEEDTVTEIVEVEDTVTDSVSTISEAVSKTKR